MVYTISYISRFRRNQNLIDCIKNNFQGWAILGPSLFLVATEGEERSSEDIKRVYDTICAAIEPGDKVFVSLFCGQAIWAGFKDEKLINWLDSHKPSDTPTRIQVYESGCKPQKMEGENEQVSE